MCIAGAATAEDETPSGRNFIKEPRSFGLIIRERPSPLGKLADYQGLLIATPLAYRGASLA